MFAYMLRSARNGSRCPLSVYQSINSHHKRVCGTIEFPSVTRLFPFGDALRSNWFRSFAKILNVAMTTHFLSKRFIDVHLIRELWFKLFDRGTEQPAGPGLP